MPALITEEHLLGLLTSLGLSRDSLADYEHGDLVGLSMALLENEAFSCYDPKSDYTHSFKGFINGITAIAATAPGTEHSTNPEQSILATAGTVSLSLAEHTIARVIEQITILDNKDPKVVPFTPAILHGLYAAGCLISLMHATGEPAELSRAIREVQGHMTASRKGLNDVKKALREHKAAH